MPIVFEAPQPMRGDIASAYGAAQQFSNDLSPLVSQANAMAGLYESIGRNRLAASEGLANRQAHQAGIDAQLQAEQMAQGQRFNQQQFLQNQQFGQQEGMQQQHFSMQDQLNANQLTRGEAMRLERLKQGVSAIQEQVQSGQLTPEEGSQLQLQYRTGINPLQARLSKSQALHSELANEQMRQQTARQTALWNHDQQYRASNLQDRLTSMVDPDTGAERQFFIDRHGEPHPIEFPQTADSGAPTAQTGSSRTRAAGGAGAGPDTHKLYGDAEKFVKEQFPTLTGNDLIQRIDQEYNRRLGLLHPQPQVTDANRRAAEYRQALTTVNRLFPDAPRTVRQQMATGLAQQNRQGQPEPFPASNNGEVDRDRLNVSQQIVMQQYDTARERARELPPERRDHFLSLIGRAERLRARYGVRLESMPPPVRQQYLNMIDVIDRLPRVPATPPPRPVRNDLYPGTRPGEALSEEERRRAESVAGM